jgi:hypothetical protein
MALYLRAATIVLFLFRMWRRLPARQKRQALRMLQRHGFRVATQAARHARARRPSGR